MRPLALLIALTLLPAAAAPTTAAANYSVIQCVPQTVPNLDGTPAASGVPKIYQIDECVGGPRPGWGLSLEANGQSNRGEWRAWVFNAPDGTSFASATASVHQRPGYGYGALYSGAAGTFGINNEWSTVSVSDTPFFAISLQCFAATCQSPGGAGNTNLEDGWAFITNIQFNVADFFPPSLHVQGPLFSGGVARGEQALSVGSGDKGAGVRAITVDVNGTRSATRLLCGPEQQTGAYRDLQPCPALTSIDLVLNTERDPGWTNGPNEVVVCSQDAAGNSSECLRRVIEVDNSCPGSGGRAAEELRAGLDTDGQLRTVAHSRSSETPVVRGALRNGAGNPVQGATVCVYETVALEDGSRQLVSTTTTQANGRFATQLEPGPSRSIDVVYRFNDRVLADRLQLRSSVVPAFKLLEKSVKAGQAAHFRGALPGPSASSRVIALQARAGRKWRTFKQLRTDALGAFRGKYPFRQTFGAVTYRFRALVKRQGEYPYEPGSSRTRKLHVRGRGG